MKLQSTNLAIFGKLGIAHALARHALRSDLIPDDSPVEKQPEILIIGACERRKLQEPESLHNLRVTRNILGNHTHESSTYPVRASEHENALRIRQHDRPRIREVRLYRLFTLALDAIRCCGSQIAFLLNQRYQRQRQHAAKLLHISPFWGKEHALYLANRERVNGMNGRRRNGVSGDGLIHFSSGVAAWME